MQLSGDVRVLVSMSGLSERRTLGGEGVKGGRQERNYLPQ